MIDKDLQSILKPLNMMQAILCPKYRIRDDAIIVNNFRYGFLSVVGLFMITIPHLYALWFNLRFGSTGLLSSVVRMGYATYSFFLVFGFLMHYYLTMKHRHKNIVLLLKIQNAQRIYKIDANRHMIINWAIVVVFNCFFFFWLYFFYFTVEDIWSQVLKIYFTIIFDLHVMYAARLLNTLS